MRSPIGSGPAETQAVGDRGDHGAARDTNLRRALGVQDYATDEVQGLLAAVGVALGTPVRAQLGVVIGLFAWAFFVESILGGLFNSIGPYLPFTAAAAIVAGLAIVLSLIASRTSLRHDIAR